MSLPALARSDGAILWGYGLWWLLLAVLTTARYLREGLPFNVGWWGFTSPLGVYSVATLALALQTHLTFLLATGGALVVCLTVLRTIIAARTAHGAWTRRLFVSPCLLSGAIPGDFEADAVLACHELSRIDPRMTLEQLRVFVAVAERQHVTRAAKALNLAQSAASAAIATLEARHGAKLFHLVGRGIELTEAGLLFLVEARAVLARAVSAELVLSELGGLKRSTLAMQASKTIASC